MTRPLTDEEIIELQTYLNLWDVNQRMRVDGIPGPEMANNYALWHRFNTTAMNADHMPASPVPPAYSFTTDHLEAVQRRAQEQLRYGSLSGRSSLVEPSALEQRALENYGETIRRITGPNGLYSPLSALDQHRAEASANVLASMLDLSSEARANLRNLDFPLNVLSLARDHNVAVHVTGAENTRDPQYQRFYADIITHYVQGHARGAYYDNRTDAERRNFPAPDPGLNIQERRVLEWAVQRLALIDHVRREPREGQQRGDPLVNSVDGNYAVLPLSSIEDPIQRPHDRRLSMFERMQASPAQEDILMTSINALWDDPEAGAALRASGLQLYQSPIYAGSFTEGYGRRGRIQVQTGGSGSKFHEGVDMVGPVGDRILPAIDGDIPTIQFHRGTGLTVNLVERDASGNATVMHRYGHLGSLDAHVAHQISMRYDAEFRRLNPELARIIPSLERLADPEFVASVWPRVQPLIANDPDGVLLFNATADGIEPVAIRAATASLGTMGSTGTHTGAHVHYVQVRNPSEQAILSASTELLKDENTVAPLFRMPGPALEQPEYMQTLRVMSDSPDTIQWGAIARDLREAGQQLWRTIQSFGEDPGGSGANSTPTRNSGDHSVGGR